MPVWSGSLTACRTEQSYTLHTVFSVLCYPYTILITKQNQAHIQGEVNIPKIEIAATIFVNRLVILIMIGNANQHRPLYRTRTGTAFYVYKKLKTCEDIT